MGRRDRWLSPRLISYREGWPERIGSSPLGLGSHIAWSWVCEEGFLPHILADTWRGPPRDSLVYLAPQGCQCASLSAISCLFIDKHFAFSRACWAFCSCWGLSSECWVTKWCFTGAHGVRLGVGNSQDTHCDVAQSSTGQRVWTLPPDDQLCAMTGAGPVTSLWTSGWPHPKVVDEACGSA